MHARKVIFFLYTDEGFYLLRAHKLYCKVSENAFYKKIRESSIFNFEGILIWIKSRQKI